MLVDGKAGAIIDLKEAKDLIRAFQNRHPEEMQSFLIDKDLIRKLLDQEDCVRVRIYNGYNEQENKPCPVIIGVNSRNEDMTGGIILERAINNPPPTNILP